MIRVRRRDRLWLTIVSILTALAIFATSIPLMLKFGIFALFLVMVGLVVFDFDAMGALRSRVAERPRGTAQAREALERATNSGGGDWVGLSLDDIGLIASLETEDGLTYERTRTITNEFDGVRPYVQLNAGPGMAERRARIRYELLDPSGESRFVYEDNAYLRLGENTLHPDQHLPLGELTSSQMGKWDIRVHVDGRLIGMLSFTATPTDGERLGRLGDRRDRPTSFEDLLRQGRGDRE